MRFGRKKEQEKVEGKATSLLYGWCKSKEYINRGRTRRWSRKRKELGPKRGGGRRTEENFIAQKTEEDGKTMHV